MNSTITSDIYKNSKSSARVYPTQMQTQSFGNLRVRCTAAGEIPIKNATITITLPSNPNTAIERLTTDSSGLTPTVQLAAPPKSLSLQPEQEQPYSEYNLQVTASGYAAAYFSNIQILPEVDSAQDVRMITPAEETQPEEETFVIGPHTLYGDYPPKIPEDEIKPTSETGAIVLARVIVPEYVVVHDGPPDDSSAPNYYIRFRDYIKNVASSEIYATWPEASIYANVFAILSFTLNRVFTEWYRNKGFNFTITSSTAYDHKWIKGRNIYTNIGLIVDSVFNNYLSRPNVKQPILTQYCDGIRVTCPNWLSQWGSKDLGDQGYSAINILRHYYGSSIYINTAVGVAGVPVSFPGRALTIGSSGDNVRTIQNQLNKISTAYSAIPKVAVDGIYGPATAAAVRAFQNIFNLPVTGSVDFATWYKISALYVAIARLAA